MRLVVKQKKGIPKCKPTQTCSIYMIQEINFFYSPSIHQLTGLVQGFTDVSNSATLDLNFGLAGEFAPEELAEPDNLPTFFYASHRVNIL